VEIKKVDAECEYLGECGSCVWVVERRMGIKWVLHSPQQQKFLTRKLRLTREQVRI